MRATIVVEDNIVLIEGEAMPVDCKALIADGIRAVQWYEVFGEVEYRTELDTKEKAFTRKGNEKITDFSPYQKYVDEWEVEKAKHDAALEAQKARQQSS